MDLRNFIDEFDDKLPSKSIGYGPYITMKSFDALTRYSCAMSSSTMNIMESLIAADGFPKNSIFELPIHDMPLCDEFLLIMKKYCTKIDNNSFKFNMSTDKFCESSSSFLEVFSDDSFPNDCDIRFDLSHYNSKFDEYIIDFIDSLSDKSFGLSITDGKLGSRFMVSLIEYLKDKELGPYRFFDFSDNAIGDDEIISFGKVFDDINWGEGTSIHFNRQWLKGADGADKMCMTKKGILGFFGSISGKGFRKKMSISLECFNLFDSDFFIDFAKILVGLELQPGMRISLPGVYNMDQNSLDEFLNLLGNVKWKQGSQLFISGSNRFEQSIKIHARCQEFNTMMMIKYGISSRTLTIN